MLTKTPLDRPRPSRAQIAFQEIKKIKKKRRKKSRFSSQIKNSVGESVNEKYAKAVILQCEHGSGRKL